MQKKSGNVSFDSLELNSDCLLGLKSFNFIETFRTDIFQEPKQKFRLTYPCNCVFIRFLFNLYIIRVELLAKETAVCENLAIFYETQPIVRWPLQARPSGPGHHAKTLSLMLGPVCPAGPEEPGGYLPPSHI